MRARVAFAVAAALCAAGCGQRGPLYLRDNPPPNVKPAQPAPYQPIPYPQDSGDGDSAAKKQ